MVLRDGNMFGSKQDKQDRLAQIIEVLHHYPDGLSQAELTEHLGVLRSTIAQDVPLSCRKPTDACPVSAVTV